MAKNEPQYSQMAKSILNDATSLVGRASAYIYSIDTDRIKLGSTVSPTLEERQVLLSSSILSSIEGLGAGIFRNFLNDQQINELATALNEGKNQKIATLTNQVSKDKLELDTARTIASIKGFDLPLSMGGPANELNYYGLDNGELLKAMGATKQAIINLNSKDIPNTQYSQELIEETTKLLKESGVAGDKLDSYTKFIEQGKKNRKPYDALTPVERAVITDAAINASKEMIKLTKSTDLDILNSEIDNTIKNKIMKVYKLEGKEQEELSKKLDSIKELWQYSPANLNNEKIKYLENPSNFKNITSASQAFDQVVGNLIQSSGPDQLKNLESKTLAQALLNKAITSLEKDKNYKLSPEAKANIIKKLEPTLSSLGSEHLAKNMDSISSNIAKKVHSQRSIFSRITGKNTISTAELEKIGTEIVKEEMPTSLATSTKKFSDERIRTALTNKDFEGKLKTYADSQGIKDDLSKKSNAELVKIRAENPKAFDAVVFPSKTKSTEQLTESPKFTQAQAQIRKASEKPNRSLPTMPQSSADIKLPPLPKTPKGSQKGGGRST